jgi:ABC-2 type transport system permease protein
LLIIISAVVAAIAATGISIALNMQSWYGAAEAIPALNLIIGLVIYFLPLFILLAFIWAFGSISITNEKVNGNIECLLATPLDPKTIWAGKSLSIFIPAYLVSIMASCIVVLAVNLTTIQPGWNVLILPTPALINGLIINPLLFYGILEFIVLFSLINNPDIAIAPSFLIGFGLMIGIPVGLLTGAIDITSWNFALWYLGGTTMAWVIVLYLSRWLTRQNIVLSSKGS